MNAITMHHNPVNFAIGVVVPIRFGGEPVRFVCCTNVIVLHGTTHLLVVVPFNISDQIFSNRFCQLFRIEYYLII